ncbi:MULTISPECIES: ABC transporter permease [Brachybacterium]|uniref:ABC transporter permease n=1 Tax=Brachybacterium TaxID=43668 RepID=UPI0006C1283A|nr:MULTISPECIES: ABC transporter permease [Brachybacterium]GAP79627.1 ABC transporter, permease protein [Brachybacterium sp. SW0106-09]
MSVLAPARPVPHPADPAEPRSAGFLTGLLVLSRRSLLHSFRDPESVLMAVLLPVMMMLIFVYVLGGTMSVGDNAPSHREYLAYVLPAIALTAAGFGASYTAVVISNDMTTGLIDRLRTMPFPAVTVLLGHTVASMARNLVATVVVVLVALAVGFRTDAPAVSLLGAFGLIALWILVITVVFATLGLLVGSAEAASGYGFILLFLPYLSSGFAPVGSMPGWLRVFAEHQPMTPLIDASRALMHGRPPGGDVAVSVLWCAGLIALALVVAAYVLPRRTSR